MCRGLKTLHSMKILHRDLKCANVFMTSNGDLKLGDLNVSKVAKQGLVRTQTGTPYYASPEVWRDQPYDAKSDIWSLGCVVYEMAALKPPFRAADMQGLYNKVQKGIYDRIPNRYSNDLAAMMSSCLQVNPNNRPTVDTLLASPFLNEGGEEESKKAEKEVIVAGGGLLGTIQLPKNLKLLSEKLPKANYMRKPANEMENLYSNQGFKGVRVLSAGIKRSESNSDLTNNGNLNAGNNAVQPPKIMNVGRNNSNNNNLIVKKEGGQGLPPKPTVPIYPGKPTNNPYGSNVVAIKNGQHQVISINNMNNNNKLPPQNNSNKLPPQNNNNSNNVNFIQKNVQAYQENRPNSRGNNNVVVLPKNSSRENSKEKYDLKGRQNSLNDIRSNSLEKKSVDSSNNEHKGILFQNNNELMKNYQEANKNYDQRLFSNQPSPNMNKKTNLPAVNNKKEEKKVDLPQTKNYPGSAKNINDKVAGKGYNQNNKPSWWG